MISFDSLAWINLEPIAACNLSCPGCPRDNTIRSKRPMEMDIYRKLLLQVPDGCEVRLFLSGEPFLDPNLANRVRMATDLGLRTSIHTNGTSISRDRAWDVIGAGATTISVSIDGEDAEQYVLMRRGAHFKGAMFGLRELLDARDAIGPWTSTSSRSGTRIELQTIVPYPQPTEPNRDIPKELLDRVDLVRVRHPHTWAQEGSVQGAAPWWSSVVCSFLKVAMSVQADGLVVPCCACLNQEHVMGDSRGTPLRDIWEGPMEEWRQAQAERRPLPVCSGCERYGVK